MHIIAQFRTLLLVILFTILSSVANAQGYTWGSGAGSSKMIYTGRGQFTEFGDKWYSANRLEWGWGLMYTNYYFEGDYEKYSFASVSDKAYFKQVKPSIGYSFIAGYSYPLTKFTEKSTLALTVNVMFSVFQGKNEDYNFTNNRTITDFSVTHMGFPLSLDYKSGADAVYDKAYNVMYNVGLGMYPNVTEYSMDDLPLRFKVNPYFKAEIGIRFGIAMKLRAMYIYRNAGVGYEGHETSDTKNSPSNLQLNYKGNISQDPELTVAIILMPFSFLWEKYK